MFEAWGYSHINSRTNTDANQAQGFSAAIVDVTLTFCASSVVLL
jgi:hypothetical protein